MRERECVCVSESEREREREREQERARESKREREWLGQFFVCVVVLKLTTIMGGREFIRNKCREPRKSSLYVGILP